VGKRQCFPWEQNTICFVAAGHGHLEVLKWFKKERAVSWDHLVSRVAALKRDFEMLKWLRENGCPWKENTCSDAAAHGQLEVLKWARENGASWNEDTCGLH